MCSRFSGLLLLLPILLLTFTTAALAAPNAPTYLAVSAETSTRVVLLWNDNSADETGFEIWYYDYGTAQFLSYGIVAANQTGVALTTPAGFSSAYAVRAVNGSGVSSFTPVVFCTQAAFNAPGSLNGLVNQESTLITWGDNATTETGFEIETRKLPAGAFSLLGSVGANVAVVDLTGFLDPDSSYEVRIRARTGASAPYTYTGYSNTASLTTQFNAPTGLTATTASEGTVNLSWVDNSTIEGGYAVYYRLGGSGSYTLVTYTEANATTYSVTGLTAGRAYDFQVAAAYQSTAIIESARSNTASATTKDGFTSPGFITFGANNTYTYQATTSNVSPRTSWNPATGLPAGMSFSTTTGAITGAPTQFGLFSATLSASFADGSTATLPLAVRVARLPAAPTVTMALPTGQTFAPGDGAATISLAGKFADPDTESAVRLVTTKGNVDVLLYPTATPATVTNFLGYVNRGDYDNSAFHRISDIATSGVAVLQGGQVKPSVSGATAFTSITAQAAVQNEPGISNLNYTIAMAKQGNNPNSATKEFYFNLTNLNAVLDPPSLNGGFTVFGRVSNATKANLDAMATAPVGGPYSTLVDGVSTNTGFKWPMNVATAGEVPALMDNTKIMKIVSATPVSQILALSASSSAPGVATAAVVGSDLVITPVGAGQSDVTVTATDLDGMLVTQTITVTVNTAPVITNGPPPNTAVVGTTYNFAYTASGFPAPAFSHTGSLPPGLSLSSAGVISGTPTTAGTYSNIVVTASNGVGTAATQTISITTHQAPAFTSSPPTSSGTYDTAYNFTCTASGSPAPTFSLATGTLPLGLTLSTSGAISGTPASAGTYTGTLSASNGIGSADTQSFSITIQKAAATVALGSLAQTFTGSPLAATSTTTPSNLNVTYTYDGSSTAPANAGSYAVVATINEPNYIGTASGTLVIAKAAATLNLGGLAQTFDGSAKAISATTTPAGLTVTFTYNGSATTPTNAGSYAVVGTISEANYSGSDSGTLVIAKATATVSLGSLAQTYDGSAKAATATTSPTGLTVNFTYDGLATAPTNAGSYAVIGTISDTNYAGASSPGTLVIAKATAGVTLGNLTQDYDGNPKPASASTSPAGLSVSLTYNGSSTAPSSHGSYAVAATVNDANYNGSNSSTLIIQGQSSTDWRAQHFSPEQITAGLAADDADPDGDGWKNLAEYALGMNPTSRNPALLPVRDANGLTLTFTRPKDMPDVTYGAQSTDNFDGWDALTLELVSDGPVQTMRARDPLTSGNPSRRIMQLIFDLPPPIE